MKTLFLLSLLAAFLLAGCMTRYDVHLNNGTKVTSNTKPYLNPQKTAWVITDASGQVQNIPAGRVTEVGPQSMDSSNKFKSAGTLQSK